jgi:Tol biopolymer transport system component
MVNRSKRYFYQKIINVMKTHLIFIVSFVLLTGILTAQDKKASVALAAAVYEEEVTGNLDKAVELYLDILKNYPDDRPVAAKTLYHLGLVNEKMGRQKASEYFTRLVNSYPDQTEVVTLAKAKLAEIGNSDSTIGTVGLTTRRILADASDVHGMLAPDGKSIMYLERGTGDVVQYEIASRKTNRIINKGPLHDRMTYVEGFVFSRDGKQIAYDRYTMEGKPQLNIRNLDCSDLRTIYDESSTIPFDWSPDGGFILAFRGVINDEHQLVLISTADSSVDVLRSINSAPYMLTKASFSPDGRFIAFSLVNDGNPPQGDIYLMTADGHNEMVVAGHPAEDELLAWTPDGKNLLFLSDRSGTWDVWTITISEGKPQGEPELLKKDFGKGTKFLGFAPDGSLYYKSASPSGHLYFGEIDLESGKVLVPPAAVTTRFNGPPSKLTWSPDGSSLLYVSGGFEIDHGNNNLTIRSTETGEERFLSTRLRKIWDLYWAPDSRSILAWGMTVKENAIFRIDAETGGIIRLADGRWTPRISANGKTMVYMGEGGITKRNLDTGEESVGIKAGTEDLKSFDDISPDGQEVTFQENGTIYTAPLAGGEPRKLLSGLSHYYLLRWTWDGHYIIAQALDDKTGLFAHNSDIWRIPMDNGTPLKLDLPVPKMDFFTLHPDNRHFAFSVNNGTREELWVMENFLPK